MSIATRNQWLQNFAAGKGYHRPGKSLQNSSATTAAAAASGFISAQLAWNSVGTTIPTTLVSVPLPPAPTAEIFNAFLAGISGAGTRCLALCRIYRFGTLNLAATGNQFTHDSSFTQLRRTEFGEASKPISLIPLVYITTATTVTPPVFRLRTVAGGSGYTDQDGNATVGAATMTMPSAATAINSAFIFRLEAGDSAVRNISNIEVTTAGSAGAASIFGIEPIAPISLLQSTNPSLVDNIFGGFGPGDMNPAVPDAGVVTSYLGFLSIGATSAPINNAFFMHGGLNA